MRFSRQPEETIVSDIYLFLDMQLITNSLCHNNYCQFVLLSGSIVKFTPIQEQIEMITCIST